MSAAAPASISLEDKSVARVTASVSSAMSSLLPTDCSPWEQSHSALLGPCTFGKATLCLPRRFPYNLASRGLPQSYKALWQGLKEQAAKDLPWQTSSHSPAPVPPGGSTTPGAKRDPSQGSYLRATKCSSCSSRATSSSSYNKRRRAFGGSR